MSFADLFKSKERRTFEKAIAAGASYREASLRASQANRLDLNKDAEDVFAATGSYGKALDRARGAEQLGLKGIAKDVYLATGSSSAAYRAQQALED